MSNRKYFGTDGIRGRVGDAPITPEFVLKLGWAAGKVLARHGSRKIIIGKDTRISGYMLESALEAGLAAAGLSASFTGPMPTPAIAYLTRAFRAEAGIVISASHNPFYDNGIKFFSIEGTKLPDDVEEAIEAEMEKELTCVDSAELGKASRIVDAAGRYKGQPVTGNGKIGGMLALRSASTPFPLQGDFRSGNTRVAFSGTVSDPLNVGGIDLRLKFAGDSLRDLYDLTGVLLPETPSFSTDGHLRADFKQKNRMRFDYQDFNGRIGDSDIHGSLTYTTGKPRPKLSGDMESKQLRLADLGPLIGVDSGKGTKKGAARQAGDRPQPAGKVLPADRFETDKWQMMDADVRFKGRRIEHGGTLPISDLATHVILEDGDLRLQPVRFGLANGSIAGSVHLQGDKKPLQGEANLQARRLKLKALMPNVEMMQKTLGEMNGDVQLRGSGNSVAALLGNSNGNLKLLMNDGLISRNLMEILGLNVGNYLIGQIFGDEEVRVNCAAANIDVTNGVARPQIFAFDTENALINVTGTASFASEQLDLTIDPESKGFRVITLRSPLYVRGTFKSPQAGVKAGPLIVRGAVAAALATLVTPAAALLALVSPAEGDSNQCRTILSQMKK